MGEICELVAIAEMASDSCLKLNILSFPDYWSIILDQGLLLHRSHIWHFMCFGLFQIVYVFISF